MKIGVIGLGYVGLPLALLFARRYEVYGFDVDNSKIEALNSGRSYIVDVSDSDISSSLSSFHPSSDSSLLKDVDAFFITVPTPVHVDGSPNMDYVISAGKVVSEHLTQGKLVVLESTVYPGATEEVLMPILESTGLKAGNDFGVVFSPERVTPGNPKYTVEKMPKVVGGCDSSATRMASMIYSSVLEAPVTEVRDCRTAEAVKILENTFRFINISLMNELAMVFERMGIDIWEVIKGASSKPIGFMPHYPGPGIGGHCIPVDPLFLLYRIRRSDMDSSFIELAWRINTIAPIHMVNLTEKGLSSIGKSLRGSKVLVCGVAYKPEVNDYRESPAIEIIEELEYSGAVVDFYDPYVNSLPVDGRKMDGMRYLTEELLSRYDALMLVTEHKDVVNALRKLLPSIERKVVVDGRNSLDTNDIRKAHIYIGVGKPAEERS